MPPCGTNVELQAAASIIHHLIWLLKRWPLLGVVSWPIPRRPSLWIRVIIYDTPRQHLVYTRHKHCWYQVRVCIMYIYSGPPAGATWCVVPSAEHAEWSNQPTNPCPPAHTHYCNMSSICHLALHTHRMAAARGNNHTEIMQSSITENRTCRMGM